MAWKASDFEEDSGWKASDFEEPSESIVKLKAPNKQIQSVPTTTFKKLDNMTGKDLVSKAMPTINPKPTMNYNGTVQKPYVKPEIIERPESYKVRTGKAPTVNTLDKQMAKVNEIKSVLGEQAYNEFPNKNVFVNGGNLSYMPDQTIFKDWQKKYPDAAKKLELYNLTTTKYDPAGTALLNATDSASLGAFSTLNQRALKKQFGDDYNPSIEPTKQSATQNPKAAIAGNIAGYIAPGALIEKGAKAVLKPVLNKVTSTLGKRAITGGVAGGAMELAEGNIRGEDAGQIAKRVAIGTGLGVVGDVVLGGVTDKLGGILTKNKVNTMDNITSKYQWLKQNEAKPIDKIEHIANKNNINQSQTTYSPNAKLKDFKSAELVANGSGIPLITKDTRLKVNKIDILSNEVNSMSNYNTYVKDMMSKYNTDKNGIWAKISDAEMSKLETLEKEKVANNIQVENVKSNNVSNKKDINITKEEDFAKKSYDNKEIPDGWYVHGRNGRQDLETGNVIQLTKNWDTADQYAGSKGGSKWMLSPKENSKIMDMTDSVTRRKVILDIVSDYKKGKLEYYDDLTEIIKNRSEHGGLKSLESGFNPKDIVDSAENWDNQDFVRWFNDRYEVDMAITKDGAVAFNTDNINKIKVPDTPRTSGVEKKIKDNTQTPSGVFSLPQTKLNDFKSDELVANRAGIELITKETRKTNPKQPNTDFVSSTIDKVVSRGDKALKPNLKYRANQAYASLVDKGHFNSLFDKATGSKGANSTAIAATNVSGFKGTTSYIIKNNLVNKNGDEILDYSIKKIMDELPQGVEKEFADYVAHRANINRFKEGKPIFGQEVDSTESLNTVAKYNEKYPYFEKLATARNTFRDEFNKAWRVDTGLISESLYNKLKEMYPDHASAYRVQTETAKLGGSGSIKTKATFGNQSSGIKKAKGGDSPFYSPLESDMLDVARTVKAAKYNQIGQTIADAIRSNPEGAKPFAEIIKPELITDTIESRVKADGMDGLTSWYDDFNNQFEQTFKKKDVPLNKPNIIRVLENGEPTYIQINDTEYMKSVMGLGYNPSDDIGKLIGTITNTFKATTTGYNPVFAVKNIARDIPTSYINGSEKNPLKFVSDLKDAAKEMNSNGENWKRYKALGGPGTGFNKELYNTVDSLYKGYGKKTLERIGSFSETLEQLPRFAEYLRTTKRYGDTVEGRIMGLYNAAENTVNFSRFGTTVKSADKYIPYLNTSVQGIDRFARQVIKNPLSTLGKGVLAVTVPSVALYIINKDNPNYNNLDNRTKDTNFLIPMFWEEKDENGYSKTFIKIPKTREYGAIMGAFFERVLRAAHGQDDPFKRLGQTMSQNFGPVNPLTSNIFSPIIGVAVSNKDWAGRPIVPRALENLSPRYQYDENTTNPSKFIGDKLNISPKKIDYLIDSYLGIIGDAYINGMKDKGGNAGERAVSFLKRQFTANSLYNTDVINQFYENKSKLDTAKRDYTKAGTKDKNYDPELLKQFNSVSDDLSDYYKELRTLDPIKDERKILEIRNKMIYITKTQNKKFKK